MIEALPSHTAIHCAKLVLHNVETQPSSGFKDLLKSAPECQPMEERWASIKRCVFGNVCLHNIALWPQSPDNPHQRLRCRLSYQLHEQVC
ncbi:hypothetical protein [Deinococcus ruber]|uniref:hypothetical protein n=1 Tax=Deinococcus ruber TaxID=1848197 RepID=UPI00166F01D7|nr:hypothetical protein [Deinococcus ruber]